MPSSSEAVATSAFSAPLLSRCFGVEPALFRQAAVMRRDLVGAEPLRQRAGGALGHAAGVDEDQRRAVRLDQLGDAVVDLLPDLARHDRFERRGRQFEREIARPDDGRCR